jgi:hypothetical protein
VHGDMGFLIAIVQIQAVLALVSPKYAALVNPESV